MTVDGLDSRQADQHRQLIGTATGPSHTGATLPSVIERICATVGLATNGRACRRLHCLTVILERPPSSAACCSLPQRFCLRACLRFSRGCHRCTSGACRALCHMSQPDGWHSPPATKRLRSAATSRSQRPIPQGAEMRGPQGDVDVAQLDQAALCPVAETPEVQRATRRTHDLVTPSTVSPSRVARGTGRAVDVELLPQVLEARVARYPGRALF